jgi:hypothetical protein
MVSQWKATAFPQSVSILHGSRHVPFLHWSPVAHWLCLVHVTGAEQVPATQMFGAVQSESMAQGGPPAATHWLLFESHLKPAGQVPVALHAGGAWQVPIEQTQPPQSPFDIHDLATQVLP